MQATEAAIQILNEANQRDPDVVSQLVNHRVQVDSALYNHPDIVTTAEGQVGMIGILNGILTRMGQPKVIVVLAGYKILGFSESGKPVPLDFD